MGDELFASAAFYYARYRPFYPDDLIRDVVARFTLSKDDRVIDIGAGTGQLSIQLALYAKEVVAVEPDEEMIDEGKKLCEVHGAKNIRWVASSAEDMGGVPGLGSFKIAVFGKSFHWLDRDRVLQHLASLLRPSGGIVIVGAPSMWESTEGWELEIKELVQKYLGKERRAGSGTFRRTDETYTATLQRAGYVDIAHETYSREERFSVEQVIGELYSTSYGNPRLFGERKDAFERELRDLLSHLSPSGVFVKNQEYFGLFAKKQ